MREKTRAIDQTGPCRLEQPDLRVAEIGADDALLRVEACGICRSDFEQCQGGLPLPFPVVPGHEPLDRTHRGSRCRALGRRTPRSSGRRDDVRVPILRTLACEATTTCAGAGESIPTLRWMNRRGFGRCIRT
ncbi:MAG: alcohol dehydrogenase catalytic domain-containing protein [Deltaproteobacteria bacterium]|nr:alcohol dehydrogenase catalytic domain-containing protein [Deltaproteobacteria bacterium]